MKNYSYNDNNFAVAYYRFSSSGQNEESIDQQREKVEDYAEKNGFTIIKEYKDEAISGRDDFRPDFLRMLDEIPKLKPAVLIIWKTDRLSRDRVTLTVVKDKIRSYGCSIRVVAEYTGDGKPEGVIFESMLDGYAEYYSINLSINVRRAVQFNSEHCRYLRPLLGYKKSEDKRYAIDEKTAPVVERIFREYADGRFMTDIIRDLTDEGVRAITGKEFTVNSIRAILHNPSYMGVYHYADHVAHGGLPAIVSEELFEEVQQRFAKNKRRGAQRANGLDDEEPRYWLTGKLFCGECGQSMHGLSGTSKTGKIHYYYECKNHRKKKDRCHKKNVAKPFIEALVIDVLEDFLSDSENLASLAVDVSNYYKKMHSSDGAYLKGLKKQLKEAEKALSNLVKALEMGIFSETTQARLLELEEQKKSLKETIKEEELRQSVLQDDYSIKHYFEMYAKANFTNTDVRDMILNYFINKIYVYDDKLLITLWYSEEQFEVPFCDISTTMTEFERSASGAV